MVSDEGPGWATWAENWGTLVPHSPTFLVLPGLDELHLDLKSPLGRGEGTPSAKHPSTLAWVMNPVMLVLGSSGCLSALEGGRRDWQPSPVHAMIGKAMLAGGRSMHMSVCLTLYVCIWGGLMMKDRYDGYIT